MDSVAPMIIIPCIEILLGYILLVLVKFFINRWAANETAYANTSIVQIFLIIFVAVSLIITLATQSEIVALFGLLGLFNSLVVAVWLCLIYEKATGFSLITGKQTAEKPDARPLSGRAHLGKPLQPLRPKPPVPVKWPWRKPKFGSWTVKGGLAVSLGIALAILAYFTYNELLYFPAAAVISLLLLDYLYCYLAFRRMRWVTVSREMPAYAAEDSVIEVKIRLNNPHGKLNHLVIVDRFPAETPRQRERRIAVASLEGGDIETFSYQAACYRRGTFDNGPMELRGEFPLGLFKNRIIYDEYSRIKIYPHLYQVRSFPLHAGGSRERTGLNTIEKAGLSNDFFGIREYRSGDSRRLLHWRSSAKRGVLMVKELEKPSDLDLTAVIDLNNEAWAGDEKYNTFEYSVKIVGSLGWLVMQKGFGLKLVALGDGHAERSLKKGLREFPLMLDFLADVRPKGREPLSRTIMSLEASSTSGTTLLLPLQAPEPGIVASLMRLRRKDVETVVILFDRSTFTLSEEAAASDGGAFIETLRRLEKHGFATFVVKRDDGPVQALMEGSTIGSKVARV